jgi:hypothetical protein
MQQKIEQEKNEFYVSNLFKFFLQKDAEPLNMELPPAKRGSKFNVSVAKKDVHYLPYTELWVQRVKELVDV